jgi:hypothetical protein
MGMMMIERDALDPDTDFCEGTLWPHIRAVLEFYWHHYPRRENGCMHFTPAESLETFHDAEDPSPEIAGLAALCKRVGARSDVPEDIENMADALAKILPLLPTRETATGIVLEPALRYSDEKNVEAPELYAAFPYGLYGVGLPDLDLALRTWEARKHPDADQGWQQHSIFAACLGLADEARRRVVQRFSGGNPRCRFPAFWGPFYDWLPDMDHGSVGALAFQRMVLQCRGNRILLFPAWPVDWDLVFCLPAPGKTTVSGVLRSGILEELHVSPPERANDIEICLPFVSSVHLTPA